MKVIEQKKLEKKIYDKRRHDAFRALRPPKTWRSRYRFVNDGKNSGLTAHKVIVERVLGHALPDGACIHHVDNNGQNNAHRNLVVCQDHAYHMLLHRRTAALDACGNANYLKCVFCKQWDDPKNMTLYVPKDQTSPRANHRLCATLYSRKRKEALRENSSL